MFTKYYRKLTKIIGLSVVSAVVTTSHAAEQRYIVKYKKSLPYTVLAKTLQHHYSQVKTVKPMAGGMFLITLKPTTHINASIQRLSQDPNIVFIVPDRRSKIKVPKLLNHPSHFRLPSHQEQWDQFTAPGGVMLESSPGKNNGAWMMSKGRANPPIAVAILDTGLAMNHRLTPNLLKDPATGHIVGWNFAGQNNNLSDETYSFHGTHVAGTIAATGNDIMGMGPELKIIPVKIPDGSGMFYESSVINGILWASGIDVPGVPSNPYPAKVINMSFGIDIGPGQEAERCDPAVQAAVDMAISKGVVLVAAAGNNNQANDLGAPAGCKGVIPISSVGPKGTRAYYSNYGPGVQYAAPGGDRRFGLQGAILSTVAPGKGIEGTGLGYMQGTSMASPHAAGLFGLVFALGQSQNITAEQAKKIVFSTTHSFGDADNNNDSCLGEKSCGHGIIDAFSALRAVNAGYKTILSSPSQAQLHLTSEGCPNGTFKAQAKEIATDIGSWQLVKNGCVSLERFDLPELIKMDYALTALYGKIQYKLYPQGTMCDKIGIDGAGCR